MSITSNKNITTQVWTKGASQFMEIEHTSQKNVLHPTLAKIINQSNCKRLLDYGCGDGRIIKLFRKNIKVSIYDSSPEMLKIAEKNLIGRVNKIYNNYGLIPLGYFDLVLLSMVLITVPNQKRVFEVLTNIKNSVTKKGFVLVAVSHPCFRQYSFSNFSTNVKQIKDYDYFSEGHPFIVNIQDKSNKKVLFEDYHWSFGFTINILIKAGLTIEEIIETRDDKTHKKYNSKYSPFLIIKCKKK